MNKQSILIIDDSKLINDNLKNSLQQRGFQITQAFDICTAKEILLEESFDYALLDLVLPDGDGEELLPFLQIHEEIRVIVMTSDRDTDRRENLFNFGIVVDYITKERHFDEMELSLVQLIERISTNDKLTILVVDDSHFMRTHLRILLSKRGFQVLVAIDGKEGLNIMKDKKIDAAIIDLEMPVMDGNRLLSAIRRNKANLMMPIMVVSGTNDQSKVARVIKNGANDFIKKPYANEEFLLKIDKMMQELKQQRLIKVHETKFAMYNKAIDKAAIFFKLDFNFTILYANSALSTVLIDPDEALEKMDFSTYVHDEDIRYLEELKEAMTQGLPYQRTFKLKSKNHDTSSIRLTFTPLMETDSSIQEILVIGFDVSLLQEKEELLEARVEIETQKYWEQNRLLIQQSKMASMGEMIGHIGHQWRQPLNSLALMFQKINLSFKKKKLDDELMDRSTEKAMRVIAQMSKTIDDFRDFFSSDKSLYLCKLSDIIRQTTDIIEPTLQSKQIKLNINIVNDISLHCLKNELSQVLLNIMANAMDALIGNKTENPEISITLEHNKNYATIIIDDNASGVPKDIIEKIFEPYFTTKQKDNGTGIGLYMSKTIIEEHMEGHLGVFNTLVGASFKISLPITKGISNER